MTQQIMSLLRVVLTQNYFTFQQTTYQPNRGIAMGTQFPNSRDIPPKIWGQKYQTFNRQQEYRILCKICR